MDRDNQDPGSSSEGRQRSSEPNEKGTSPDRRRRDESVARGELLKQALRQIIGWPNYYIPFHIVLVVFLRVFQVNKTMYKVNKTMYTV